MEKLNDQIAYAVSAYKGKHRRLPTLRRIAAQLCSEPHDVARAIDLDMRLSRHPVSSSYDEQRLAVKSV